MEQTFWWCLSTVSADFFRKSASHTKCALQKLLKKKKRQKKLRGQRQRMQRWIRSVLRGKGALSFIAHTVRWSLASPTATLGPSNQLILNSCTKTTEVGTLIIFKALSVSSTPVPTEQQGLPQKVLPSTTFHIWFLCQQLQTLRKAC